MSYKEVNGDLIELALSGSFDVIAHGCNCFCVQGAGIAKQMKEVFNTNNYTYESSSYLGDINKLGIIDYNYINNDLNWNYKGSDNLAVVNAYTQYQPGANLDYEALTSCLRKINHKFKGKHIGLPMIGCGIAGGVWDFMKEDLSDKEHDNYMYGAKKDVKTIIQQELKDCDVTIVNYNK